MTTLAPPFTFDVRALAAASDDFRRVLVTGPHSQVVLMSLHVGEEIGEEVHPDTDQTLVIVAGQGRAIVAGEASPIEAESLVFVPAGTRHNIVNAGKADLRLYTIYAPAHHAPGTVHHTKADAEAAERDEGR
jgi:mannose-6-phosphate isomerase-like protein (cupin superfamily)